MKLPAPPPFTFVLTKTRSVTACSGPRHAVKEHFHGLHAVKFASLVNLRKTCRRCKIRYEFRIYASAMDCCRHLPNY